MKISESTPMNFDSDLSTRRDFVQNNGSLKLSINQSYECFEKSGKQTIPCHEHATTINLR